MGNLCWRTYNIVVKKHKKKLFSILKYMKPINILNMIRELLMLILVSALTLIALLIFSVYAITASLYEMIVKGIKSGFGRNITSVRRSY